MNWIKIENELPADELRVLLRDMHGNIYIGTRDEHGYTDDHNEELINIISWSYLEDIQPRFEDVIITNDLWVTLAMQWQQKNGKV